MTTLSNFLVKIANLKTFMAFLILYIAFVGYFFPKGFKSDVPVAEQNLPILDLQWGYDPENVKSIVSMYTGAATKEAAIKGHIITDGLYPIVYVFFFGIALSLVFYKWKIQPWFKGINLLPIPILIFDYLENLMIVKMLNNYPSDISHLAVYCSVFTMIKWGFVAITMGVLVVGVGSNLLKK